MFLILYLKGYFNFIAKGILTLLDKDAMLLVNNLTFKNK